MLRCDSLILYSWPWPDLCTWADRRSRPPDCCCWWHTWEFAIQPMRNLLSRSCTPPSLVAIYIFQNHETKIINNVWEPSKQPKRFSVIKAESDRNRICVEWKSKRSSGLPCVCILSRHGIILICCKFICINGLTCYFRRHVPSARFLNFSKNMTPTQFLARPLPNVQVNISLLNWSRCNISLI